MLANPIVIPLYAEPLVWVIAFVAMAAEIRTEITMLRRWTTVMGVERPLLLINLLTWLLFLIAVDKLDHSGNRIDWILLGLEFGVVLAESLLFWAILKLRAPTTPRSRVTFVRVFWVALVGNIVSVAVSMVVPLAA